MTVYSESLSVNRSYSYNFHHCDSIFRVLISEQILLLQLLSLWQYIQSPYQWTHLTLTTFIIVEVQAQGKEVASAIGRPYCTVQRLLIFNQCTVFLVNGSTRSMRMCGACIDSVHFAVIGRALYQTYSDGMKKGSSCCMWSLRLYKYMPNTDKWVIYWHTQKQMGHTLKAFRWLGVPCCAGQQSLYGQGISMNKN